LRRETLLSGEQAALGADLRDFLDGLGLEDAFVAGYDWGERAACVLAALWPQRVRGLVSIGGYNVQNIAAAGLPAPAAQGTSPVVPMVFSGRAWPGRPRRRSPRHRASLMAPLVAELALRRGHLRGDRCEL
jgi:pimeloyl-ACP methyl ester carboxylesterase